MNAPSVSVITNSYNCASYLRANVESILQQQYQNWRHIVVDAGSTDDSLAILKGLQHPRLKVMTVPHCGVSESRNLAIAEAEGDFIAILDADDEALPGRLQVQMKCFADMPKTDLVAGGIVRVDQVSREEKTFIYPNTHESIVTLLRTSFNCLPHSTMVYRHEAFRQTGGYLTEKSEDFDFALRVSRTGRLASVRQAVIRYAHHRVGCHTESYRPKGRNAHFYSTTAVVLDAAKTADITVSISELEAWLDRLGEDGLAALQGRWAASALAHALPRGDLVLLKYLGFVTMKRLGSMARCRKESWWRDSSSPLAIARRHAVSSSQGSATGPADEPTHADKRS